MSFPTVTIPRQDLPTILSVLRELDHHVMRSRLNIDFGDRPFFAPFGMLVVAAKLRAMREANPDLRVEVTNYRAHQCPAHVGFFDMVGIDFGLKIGEAWGSRNYLPITRLSRADLEETSSDRFSEVQDLIQRHAERIATVISRDVQQNANLSDALAFSIREVMRNVFEHSECDHLYYAAQHWPGSNKVEFALADYGIGIRRGLYANPNFRTANDKVAIEWSLLPSVSGKTHLGNRSGTWFNSGYGLYMTSRLARNGGNFVLVSRSEAVHLGPSTKSNYHTSFPGTALRFNLSIERLGDLQGRLNEFRKDGARIAKSIQGSGNRPPSGMSTLLRKDYSPYRN